MAMISRLSTSGGWELVHAFAPPAVYLDHWALRLFSDDVALGSRFAAALRSAGGNWCISHQTLVEFAGPGDPKHAATAERLIDELAANIYCMALDIKMAIDAEHNNGTSSGLRPPPDHEMLSLISERLPQTQGKLTVAGLLVAVAHSKDNVGVTFRETNQSIVDSVMRQRSDPSFVHKAKFFVPKAGRSPTLTLMGEMLRPFILDSKAPFTQNDASDFQHALLSTTYCQYVLLDRKWQHVLKAASARIERFGLSFQPAKPFSQSANGIALFLQELENHGRQAGISN